MKSFTLLFAFCLFAFQNLSGQTLILDQELTTCSNFFTDNGGESDVYFNGEDLENYTFRPEDPGKKIAIKFTSFKVAEYDTMYIYNGSSESDPIIGKYTLQNSPGTIVSSHPSGALFCRFDMVDQGSFGDDGWTANVFCIEVISCGSGGFGLQKNQIGKTWFSFNAFYTPFTSDTNSVDSIQVQYKLKNLTIWSGNYKSKPRTQVRINNLLSDTLYDIRWRVKCISGPWSPFSNTLTQRTIKTKIQAFSLPTDTLLSGTGIPLNWSPQDPDITAYKVEYGPTRNGPWTSRANANINAYVWVPLPKSVQSRQSHFVKISDLNNPGNNQVSTNSVSVKNPLFSFSEPQKGKKLFPDQLGLLRWDAPDNAATGFNGAGGTSSISIGSKVFFGVQELTNPWFEAQEVEGTWYEAGSTRVLSDYISGTGDYTFTGYNFSATNVGQDIYPGTLAEDTIVVKVRESIIDKVKETGTVFCQGDSLSIYYRNSQFSSIDAVAPILFSSDGGSNWTVIPINSSETVTKDDTTIVKIKLPNINSSNCRIALRGTSDVLDVFDLIFSIKPVPSQPTISGSQVRQVCSGTTVTLAVSNPDPLSTYVWSNGATGSSISTTVNGNYTVISKLGAKCTSPNSLPISVQVKDLPRQSSISVNGNTSICQGTSVLISDGSTDVKVTFRVDISNYLSSGNTLAVNGIRIGGNFTDLGTTIPNWDPTNQNCAMVKEGNTNIWKITIAYPKSSIGSNQKFKFVNGNWGQNEGEDANNTLLAGLCGEDDGTGNINRTFTIPKYDQSLLFCWDKCLSCQGAQNQINTFQWKRNGSNIAGADSLKYPANQSGNYTLTISSGNCTSTSNQVSLTVNPGPNAPTIQGASSQTTCAGSPISLSVANPVTGTNYIWSNNQTGSSLSTNTAGQYSVRAISNGCTSAVSQVVNVVVTALPTTPSISSNGNNFTFCGTGNIQASGTGTFIWKLNGNTVIGQSNSSLTVTDSGPYTVQVVTGACTSLISPAVTVVINPGPNPPTIQGGASQTTCAGSPISLSVANPVTGTNYIWSNNQPGSSLSTNAAGQYSVRAISNGCTSAVSQAVSVSVNPLPATPLISSLGNNFTFCGTGNIQASGTGTFIWKLNGNTISGQSNSSLTVTESGPYTVQVVTGACTSLVSSAATVVINPGPNAPTIQGAPSQTTCAGSPISLSVANPVTGTNYIWSNNQTGSSLSTNTAGQYSVRAISNGCTSAVSQGVNVVVTALPTTPSISSNGNNFTFCGTGNIQASGTGTFIWKLNNLIQIGDSLSNLIVNQSGNYTVQRILNGCISLESPVQAIIINPIPAKPIIQGPADLSICTGNSLTLFILNPVSGTNYIWSNSLTGPTISINDAGLYATFAVLNGCSSSVSEPVTVVSVPTPSAPIVLGDTVCRSGAATLNAFGNVGESFAWYNEQSGGTAIQNQTSGSFTTQLLTSSRTFYVSVKNNGCESSRTAVQAFVNTFNNAGFTNIAGILSSSPSNAQFYQWLLDGNSISGSNSSTYAPLVNGNYSVIIRLDGCADTSSRQFVLVTSTANKLGSEKWLAFPNPSQNQFFVEGNGIEEISILNLFGQKILVQKASGFQETISTSSLSNGIYWLELKGNKTQKRMQLVVKR